MASGAKEKCPPEAISRFLQYNLDRLSMINLPPGSTVIFLAETSNVAPLVIRNVAPLFTMISRSYCLSEWMFTVPVMTTSVGTLFRLYVDLSG